MDENPWTTSSILQKLRLGIAATCMMAVAGGVPIARAAESTSPQHPQHGVAQKAATQVKQKATTGLADPQAAISRQFGTERLDFMVAGRPGFLLKPTRPAPNGAKPWVWYAPTFIGAHPNGHEGTWWAKQSAEEKARTSNTWLFTRLLAKGFYICGLDVGESYGNPTGRRQFTEFYQYLVKTRGLSPKPCLYPQSRGGLQLYNWAAEHPQCVLCIAGNQPVGDLRSYPGLDKACAAYGMSAEELNSHLKEHNPIDRLAPLASRKIPIIHVHGDADSLVPLGRNTMEVARRYRALGGPMDVIVAKGIPHGDYPELFAEPRILEFLLTHAFPAENK